ncbi:hypothetical protein PG995_010495 [Apiospora arundinis]
MSPFPFILVFFLILTPTPSRCSLSVAGVSTCYKRDGRPHDSDGDWVPCDPGARASPCCSTSDFCLSNGLCLDAGGDQFFTAQGCSSPSWPPDGCKEICNATVRQRSGYSVVRLCDGTDKAGSIKYCCGNNCSCSEPDLGLIPVASAVFRPPWAAGASSSSVATASAPILSTAPQPTPSDPVSDNDSNTGTRPLAIGLGIGIPLGLALIGGIVYLGLQLRKWAVATAQQGKMKNKEAEEGLTARMGDGGGGDSLPQVVEEGDRGRRMELNTHECRQ